jgi:hypothetical protein
LDQDENPNGEVNVVELAVTAEFPGGLYARPISRLNSTTLNGEVS